MVSSSAPVFYGDLGSHQRVIITTYNKHSMCFLLCGLYYIWDYYVIWCYVKLINLFFFFFIYLQVPLPFSTFIDLCKKRMHLQTQHQQNLDEDHSVVSQTNHEHDYLSLEDVPEQIYLAQVQTPIDSSNMIYIVSCKSIMFFFIFIIILLMLSKFSLCSVPASTAIIW